ncbi:MAG: hypothetical protein ACF8Q5_11445 [Phycisphaerales bacterium JB040]
MNRTRRLVAASLLGCLAVLPACNILTPVFYAVHGPGNIEAKHELNKEAATVVFVDDPAGLTTDRTLRSLLARTATETLMRKAGMADMIDPAPVIALASRDSFENPMSITEIGSKVGAKTVIYVAINRFDLQGPGQTFLPSAVVSVKVMDVEASRRVWPGAAEGHMLRVGGEYQPGDIPSTATAVTRAQESLAVQAGVGVAQLFYTHEITESVTR